MFVKAKTRDGKTVFINRERITYVELMEKEAVTLVVYFENKFHVNVEMSEEVKFLLTGHDPPETGNTLTIESKDDLGLP